jgi:phytoene synthase
MNPSRTPIIPPDAPLTLKSTRSASEVSRAFHHCEEITRRHYENFPVASFLVPREKRQFIASIYAFARAADDFADEGDAPPTERLRMIDEWERKLEMCYNGEADDPVFIALGETVARHAIPRQLLKDLLTAFRMDVTLQRFPTFSDLLFYCKHSANPVGRLVLHIFGDTHERHHALSDKICTALQLANFWQDLSVDWPRGRLYLPLEDLERFGYTVADLHARRTDSRFAALLALELGRANALFTAGKPLLVEAKRDLRLELRLTWLGGMSILKKVERLGGQILHRRPVLSRIDVLGIFLRGVVHRGL